MSSHAPPEPPLSAIRQSLLHPGVSCRRCHTLLCRHLGSEIPTGLDATRERRGEATALLVKTVIRFSDRPQRIGSPRPQNWTGRSGTTPSSGTPVTSPVCWTSAELLIRKPTHCRSGVCTYEPAEDHADCIDAVVRIFLVAEAGVG